MRNITEEEHQELMDYLYELIQQMNSWGVAQCKKGDKLYDVLMKHPYIKSVNDTFDDLLSDEVIKGLS